MGVDSLEFELSVKPPKSLFDRQFLNTYCMMNLVGKKSKKKNPRGFTCTSTAPKKVIHKAHASGLTSGFRGLVSPPSE